MHMRCRSTATARNHWAETQHDATNLKCMLFERTTDESEAALQLPKDLGDACALKFAQGHNSADFGRAGR